MNVKKIITNDFIQLRTMHSVKDIEAKVTYHFIYGKIVMAAQLNDLTLEEANHLIEILTTIYDTLPKP